MFVCLSAWRERGQVAGAEADGEAEGGRRGERRGEEKGERVRNNKLLAVINARKRGIIYDLIITLEQLQGERSPLPALGPSL